MENFNLLNLIRALSGQSEQSCARDEQPEDIDSAKSQPTAPQIKSTQESANILAGVIERHDKISYRIKSGRNKK